MISLSERLARVASYVPQGARMADIGSDHAFLPIYLAQREKISFAVAGELNEGPFRGAERNVRKRGLAEQISVRKGNGLAVITPGEVEVVTISGMGGGTMRDILSAGEDKLTGVTRLILSPQGDSEQLRKWLMEHGWNIIDEDMLVEDERIYEFIVCERGDMRIEDPAVLEFGPFLLERKHPLIIQRADYELGKIRRALPALEHAKGESGEVRRAELLARRAMLEEVKTRVQS